MPHFSSVLFAYLYHKYLSLKIEQLLEVFFGIDEHAEIKKNKKIILKYYNLQKYTTCVDNNNQLKKFNVKPHNCKYPMYDLNYL